MYEGTNPLAVLHYGDAATIWRVNLGMRRRDVAKPDGFILDLERGLWESQERLAEAQSQNGDVEEMSHNVARVIPYVEDRRNCLLFTPFPAREPAFMASLQAALKNAIQVCFQLEDSELACEPLPCSDLRTQILIYESAEGGAGVLRRLVTVLCPPHLCCAPRGGSNADRAPPPAAAGLHRRHRARGH